DNYSTLYQDALYISTNATDVATKQNEIRLESINAKIKQLKNNLESVWESLYNSKVMKFLFDGFNGIAQVLKEITTSLGSIGGFSVLGGLVAGIGFKKQIAEGTIEGVNNLKEWVSSKKQLQEAIANIKNLEHNKIELKNLIEKSQSLLNEVKFLRLRRT
ncbi:MAG: hypothetical protein N2202_10195, partial [Proteobacteria bacterium]|nr:hypothetical protein [Pseudomonadota bacterium]